MESRIIGRLNTWRIARLMLVSFVANEAQKRYLLPPSRTDTYSCEALFCRSQEEARRFLSICITSTIDGVWYSIAHPTVLVLACLVAVQKEEEKSGYIFQDLVTHHYYLAASLEEANYATLVSIIATK